MTERTNKDILGDLGIDVQSSSTPLQSPWEQRVIAGFEEIQKFVRVHNRLPNKESNEILFEAIYAIRLERLNELPEAKRLLLPLDTQGLITESPDKEEIEDSEFGKEIIPKVDITRLRHVRSSAERKASEFIASRTFCSEFKRFKPLFDQVRKDLSNKVRQTRKFGLKSEIEVGRFFIVNGQMAYVAEKGNEFVQEYGHNDARLRVIYDNGTESNVLMRSLQRALNKDKSARRVTEALTSPLFPHSTLGPEQSSGVIYVLRSLSNLREISENRDFIHKIGVTSGKVQTRIADAKRDTTYLLANVEVVKTYDMAGYNQRHFEKILHKFLAEARLDIEIRHQQKVVRPKEWYLVPLEVIDEVVESILNETIVSLKYDKNTFSIVKR